MSKRAEEAALKAYPERVLTDEYGFPEDCNLSSRIGFQEGYEQAEKDVWDRIEKYLSERNPTDFATVGWILKNIEEYKNKIMEE